MESSVIHGRKGRQLEKPVRVTELSRWWGWARSLAISASPVLRLNTIMDRATFQGLHPGPRCPVAVLTHP